MATSGTYTFTVTRDQVITSALRKIGAIPTGGTPSASQVSEGAEALNLIVKGWGANGVRLWTLEWSSVAPIASNIIDGTDTNVYTCIRSHTSATTNRPITGAQWSSYWKLTGTGGATWQTATAYKAIGNVELPAETLDVLEAYIRRGGNDFPLKQVPFEEYMKIVDKALFGLPTQFSFVAPTSVQTPMVFLWPQPDVTTDVLNYRRVKMIQDFATAANNPDVPARWFRPLVYALAADLSHEYGLTMDERKAFHEISEREFVAATKQEAMEQMRTVIGEEK